MSLKDAIQVAAKERDQQQSIEAVNTASNKAVNNANKEDNPKAVEFAALTVRVPKRSRVHWLISAKQQDTTLTAAIVEALNARFGEPDTKN
jgi:hypothetical protein